MKEQVIQGNASSFTNQNLASINRVMTRNRKVVGIKAKQGLAVYMKGLADKYQVLMSDMYKNDPGQTEALHAFKRELLSGFRRLMKPQDPLAAQDDTHSAIISINNAHQHLLTLVEQLVTDKYIAITNGYIPKLLTEEQWYDDKPSERIGQIRFLIKKGDLHYKIMEGNGAINEGVITTAPEGDDDYILNTIDDIMPIFPMLASELILKQHLRPYSVTEKPFIVSWNKRAELLIIALQVQALVSLSLLDRYFDKKERSALLLKNHMDALDVLSTKLVEVYQEMQPYRLILKSDMKDSVTVQTDYPAFLLDGLESIDVKQMEGKTLIDLRTNKKIACITYTSNLFEKEFPIAQNRALQGITRLRERLSKQVTLPLRFDLNGMRKEYEDLCNRSRIQGYFHALATLDYVTLTSYCDCGEDVNVRNDNQEHALHILYRHLLQPSEVSSQVLSILDLLLAKGLNPHIELSSQKTIEQELTRLLTRKTTACGLFFSEEPKRAIYLAARNLLQTVRKDSSNDTVLAIVSRSIDGLSDRQLNLAALAIGLFCVSYMSKIPLASSLPVLSIYLLFLLREVVFDEEIALEMSEYMNPMSTI